MKKVVAILCVMMLMTFGGCALFSEQGAQYAMGVMNLKTDSHLLLTQYEKIYNLVSAHQERFSEEEWNQLLDVHYAFTETATRVESMMKSPKDIVTPAELRQMYELAYIGYANAREIILNHRDVFSSYQWSQMENFDLRAHIYDKQVRAILEDPSNNDINMTLGVMITLGGAAYKYLLPVLVAAI